MKLLDNITWLNAMELFDRKHSVTNDIETTNDIIVNMEKLPEDIRSEIRKVKALEIIAEELIKHNVTAGCVVTALENIDAALENINANLRR